MNIKIGVDSLPENDEISIIAYLELPNVERTLIYDSEYLDNFDGIEYVLDWIKQIEGEADLLGFDFEFNKKEVLSNLCECDCFPDDEFHDFYCK